MTPELDVANALASALGLSVGTDIKLGPRQSIGTPGNDAATLWVTTAGGTGPAPFMPQASQGSWFDATVQVMVLGAADDQSAGWTKARQVRDALHCKAPSGYVMCLAQTAEPLYLGPIPEASGQHEWSVNFSLRWIA